VLLFCPALNFIDARTSGGNDRVRRFFRGREIDVERLNVVKRSIERRLRVEASRFKALEDLNQFISTRANDIILTPPRPMKVLEPRADLVALFDELVGGRARQRREGVLIPELDEPFSRLSEQGRAWKGERVRVPVLGTILKAPYAYRNGHVNLVKPQRLGPQEDARRTAGHLAIEGDLLRKHAAQLEEEYRLVVVSAGQGEGISQREQQVAPLFQEYGVKFVRNTEISEFVQQVLREAHA